MINRLNKDEIIAQSVSLLRLRISSLESIYLFGSQVNGQATEHSDIDLAFLSYDPLDNVKRWEIQESLAKLLDCNVDLVDLKIASTVMQFQIVSKGERVYNANYKVSENFENNVHFLYLDLCELRQPIINNINESGSIYG